MVPPVRTFAIVAETKGNPAVRKKTDDEDTTVVEQGEASAEDQVVPTEEDDEGDEFALGGEGEDDEELEDDEFADDEEPVADDEEPVGAALETEAAVEGEEPLEGEDGELPLDEMAAEEEELGDELDPTVDPMDQEIAEHEWAGDIVDDESVITDPSVSFRSFTGAEGETAWLDRADDGTLTGWIQDADGTTYRYADADAWAIDVDDAGMSAGGEEEEFEEDPLAEEMPVEDEGAPIDTADPAAAPLQGKTLIGIRRLP